MLGKGGRSGIVLLCGIQFSAIHISTVIGGGIRIMSGMCKAKYTDSYSVYDTSQVQWGISYKAFVDMFFMLEFAVASVYFVFSCGSL